MPEDILPPIDDEVKVANLSLKLTPERSAKINARLKATGLTKAKLFTAIMSTADAAFDGDNDALAKWTDYVRKLTTRQAQKA